jgi:hypothetical protein
MGVLGPGPADRPGHPCAGCARCTTGSRPACPGQLVRPAQGPHGHRGSPDRADAVRRRHRRQRGRLDSRRQAEQRRVGPPPSGGRALVYLFDPVEQLDHDRGREAGRDQEAVALRDEDKEQADVEAEPETEAETRKNNRPSACSARMHEDVGRQLHPRWRVLSPGQLRDQRLGRVRSSLRVYGEPHPPALDDAVAVYPRK